MEDSIGKTLPMPAIRVGTLSTQVPGNQQGSENGGDALAADLIPAPHPASISPQGLSLQEGSECIGRHTHGLFGA